MASIKYDYIQIENSSLEAIPAIGLITEGDYGTLLSRFNRNLPQLVRITDTERNNSVTPITITDNTLENLNEISSDVVGVTNDQTLNSIGTVTTKKLIDLAGKNQQLVNILNCFHNMEKYYQDNLYGTTESKFTTGIFRAARGNSITYQGNVFSKCTPYIYAENISDSLRIFIIIRGIPVELRRTNLAYFDDISSYGHVIRTNRYNAIFRFPEYAYAFYDCEDSWEKMIANEDIVGSFFTGKTAEESGECGIRYKIDNLDPGTPRDYEHNLNLAIHVNPNSNKDKRQTQEVEP